MGRVWASSFVCDRERCKPEWGAAWGHGGRSGEQLRCRISSASVSMICRDLGEGSVVSDCRKSGGPGGGEALMPFLQGKMIDRLVIGIYELILLHQMVTVLVVSWVLLYVQVIFSFDLSEVSVRKEIQSSGKNLTRIVRHKRTNDSRNVFPLTLIVLCW
ncbi:hypothetical protein EJB05_02794 [Eragrostis curvula]|uniref:Uncharacterized protein n=1 Tax=Eragrostis curvula TaxID=38414 RepID=A0A5J9WSZ7_9POAL|nr:hypothetical protein EJB05_02794 [Eragrostis curvula]